jgi:hypothetical protein
MAVVGDPWTFVRSKKGYVIAEPENAESRDFLFLLLGRSFPVILRPPWTYWEFVGECDLMNWRFLAVFAGRVG